MLLLPLTTPILLVSGLLGGAGGGIVMTPITSSCHAARRDADRGSAFSLFSGGLAAAMALGQHRRRADRGGVRASAALVIGIGADRGLDGAHGRGPLAGGRARADGGAAAPTRPRAGRRRRTGCGVPGLLEVPPGGQVEPLSRGSRSARDPAPLGDRRAVDLLDVAGEVDRRGARDVASRRRTSPPGRPASLK